LLYKIIVISDKTIRYMRRVSWKNMAEIVKFVYVMIIFYYVFLVSMNVDGNTFVIHFKFRSLRCK